MEKILEVFCFDVLGVKDKVTFDFCIVNGMHVAYWMEDSVDIKERINAIFDTLFKDVIKTRGVGRIEKEN